MILYDIIYSIFSHIPRWCSFRLQLCSCAPEPINFSTSDWLSCWITSTPLLIDQIDQELAFVLWSIRRSSPLNFSAKQQRAYFDGFGITAAAAFSYTRLAEPWEYSNTALIDWPRAGFNSAEDSFPFRHHSLWHTQPGRLPRQDASGCTGSVISEIIF